MGANAATKCLKIVDNLETVLAIELMNASQAIEYRRPKKTSTFLESFLDAYRTGVPLVDEDRLLADDIHASIAYLQSFSIDNEVLFA